MSTPLKSLLAGSALAISVLAQPLQADIASVTGIARTVDGDTIDLGVVRIRLHGIDAPEADQPCARADGSQWRCGVAAANRLADLIDDRQVRCEALDRDAYGRVIGRCFHQDVDLNALLVREGLAWAYIRFSEDYLREETEARNALLGIWQAETTPPWEYRAQRWERAAAQSPRPGCPIKGNINRQGERIYHTPWSPWYDRVQINEEQGERWFCDEAEAQAAGWRGPRR
jgi:endonuclease YncB( thermonuclease family)